MSEDSSRVGTESGSRHGILKLLDGFIDQIQQLRKIMLGMSISAIVLAPLAIGLSVYLMLHPSFFAILEIENEFGLILSVLLGAVIIVSGIWLATGITQFRSMNTWKDRYKEYSQEKEELDRKIASRFGLNEDQHS
jgi:hypothetical protein